MIVFVERVCSECSNYRFNASTKTHVEDGYDCAVCGQRVVDFFLIKNRPAESVLKKLYPPYGVPDFCPALKRETEEELEFV